MWKLVVSFRSSQLKRTASNSIGEHGTTKHILDSAIRLPVLLDTLALAVDHQPVGLESWLVPRGAHQDVEFVLGAIFSQNAIFGDSFDAGKDTFYVGLDKSLKETVSWSHSATAWRPRGYQSFLFK